MRKKSLTEEFIGATLRVLGDYPFGSRGLQAPQG